MEFIINQHGQIRNIIDESPLIAVTSTILIIAALIAVMGPITPICILTGFYFGLYYLGEYFHLFFFSMTISLLFFGG